MAIPQQDLDTFKERLLASARPLFLFDDDCDGMASFVQLYRMKGEGKGVVVKASPKVDATFLRKVDEYQPDLIVILDKPIVLEEFFEGTQTPILWLDHHAPQDVSKWKHVTYFNPRVHDDADNKPTSYWCYLIAGGPLWVATVGIVADWHIVDCVTDFAKQYHDLMPSQWDHPEDLLFREDSKLGKLIKMISFSLKGTAQDMMKSVLVLTRIESPYEIVNQTTSRGKFVYKKYGKIARKYDGLLSRAKKAADDTLLHFVYVDDEMSLTSDLSNELLYLFPEQLVVVGRKHEGEVKFSLRSASKYDVASMLPEALKGVSGYGGGHMYACGACVKEQDVDRFVKQLRTLAKKHK